MKHSRQFCIFKLYTTFLLDRKSEEDFCGTQELNKPRACTKHLHKLLDKKHEDRVIMQTRFEPLHELELYF